MLVSGVTTNFKPIGDQSMLKEFNKRFEKTSSARLLALLLGCYQVPEKEYKKLLAKVKTNQNAVNNIRQILGYGNRTLTRVAKVSDDSDKSEY